MIYLQLAIDNKRRNNKKYFKHKKQVNYSLTDYDRVSDKLQMIDRSGGFHILIINDANLT